MPKFRVEWHGVQNINGTTIVKAKDETEAIEMVQEDADMLDTEIQEMGIDNGDIEIDNCEEVKD